MAKIALEPVAPNASVNDWPIGSAFSPLITAPMSATERINA